MAHEKQISQLTNKLNLLEQERAARITIIMNSDVEFSLLKTIFLYDTQIMCKVGITHKQSEYGVWQV